MTRKLVPAMVGAVVLAGCGSDDGGDSKPPPRVPLRVESPGKYSKVYSDKVRIRGVTSPGANVTVALDFLGGDSGSSYDPRYTDEKRTSAPNGDFALTFDLHQNGPQDLRVLARKSGYRSRSANLTVVRRLSPAEVKERAAVLRRARAKERREKQIQAEKRQAAREKRQATHQQEIAAQTKTYSGNGAKNLGTITVKEESLIEWTCDGDIFQIFTDDDVPVNSQAHSGDSVLEAGSHSGFQVNAIGNWTIKIHPR